MTTYSAGRCLTPRTGGINSNITRQRTGTYEKALFTAALFGPVLLAFVGSQPRHGCRATQNQSTPSCWFRPVCSVLTAFSVSTSLVPHSETCGPMWRLVFVTQVSAANSTEVRGEQLLTPRSSKSLGHHRRQQRST